MLMTSSDPSPLVQTAVYMAGIFLGYILLVRPDEWQRAWEKIRSAWSRPSQD